MDDDYEARFAENRPEAAFERFMKETYGCSFLDVTPTVQDLMDNEE